MQLYKRKLTCEFLLSEKYLKASLLADENKTT